MPEGTGGKHADHELTQAEQDFGKAMIRWQHRHPGRVPTWHDVLAIALHIGYRFCGREIDRRPERFRVELEAYKIRTGDRHPRWSAVLGVLTRLGYRIPGPCECAAEERAT